jgi:TonB family protein
MKHLRMAAILVGLISVFSNSAMAQDNSAWIEVTPSGDFFRISMPLQPKEEFQNPRYGDLSADGKWYESSSGGASYSVWSLVNANYSSKQSVDDYLDACAELLWEGLLKSARDKLPEDQRVRARMTYVKELPAKPLSGREYSISIGELTGTTQFYIVESRIYVLLAMNSPGGVWAREKFFESFAISPNLPGPKPLYGDPVINPNKIVKSETSDMTSDMNRVFSGRDVTEKPRILEKPEPTYTEGARKFGVEGTVVLRAVFSRNGDVTNLNVTRKLPHGLTERAIRAARAIRFTPATKDGQPVSMYMQLEYNFNLY